MGKIDRESCVVASTSVRFDALPLEVGKEFSIINSFIFNNLNGILNPLGARSHVSEGTSFMHVAKNGKQEFIVVPNIDKRVNRIFSKKYIISYIAKIVHYRPLCTACHDLSII